METKIRKLQKIMANKVRMPIKVITMCIFQNYIDKIWNVTVLGEFINLKSYITQKEEVVVTFFLYCYEIASSSLS